MLSGQLPQQDDAQQSGISGLLNRPGVRNMMLGLAKGLAARAADRHAQIMPIAYQGMQEAQDQQRKQALYAASQDPGILSSPGGMQKLGLLALQAGEPALAGRLLTQQAGGLLSNFGKAMQDVQTIKQMYGENSPQYKLAQENLERLAGGSQTSLQVDPATGAISFTQGSGRGQPSSAIVDGKYVTKPTQGALTQQQKTQMSNVGREVASKYLKHPYIGRGSNAKLISDWREYQSTENPFRKRELAEKLISAAQAYMMLPDVTAQALSSQNIRSTVPALRHQREALSLGWPIALKGIVDNLPYDLQEQARMRSNQRFGEISSAMGQFAARGFPIDLSQDGSLSIPSFTSKTEFQQWYNSLSPSQKQQVKEKMSKGE